MFRRVGCESERIDVIRRYEMFIGIVTGVAIAMYAGAYVTMESV